MAQAPFLALLQEISLASCAFSFVAYASFADRFPMVNGTKSQCRWGVVSSYVDHCRVIFSSPYISASSSQASFNASIYISSLSPCDIAKLYRCFLHLDCVFPNQLRPTIQPPNSHHPLIYVRSSFGFAKDIVFRWSGLIFCLGIIV